MEVIEKPTEIKLTDFVNPLYIVICKTKSMVDRDYEIYISVNNGEKVYVNKTSNVLDIKSVITQHMIENHYRRARYYHEGGKVMKFINNTDKHIDALNNRVKILEEDVKNLKSALESINEENHTLIEYIKSLSNED